MINASATALAVVCLVSAATLAQTQSTGLKDPIALTVLGDSGHVFIVEAGAGRLLRWNREETEVLSDQFVSEGSFSSITALCVREGNLLTAIGMSASNQVRIVTSKVDVLGSVAAEQGLSRNLDLGGSIKEITAACATDFALYVAVVHADGNREAWRIPAGRTSLGKPELLIEDVRNKISSMTISPHGHLVLAVATEAGENHVRFHHAETGRLLLTVKSELQTTDSLVFSPSGLLYATGSKLDRSGIFRMDVFFDGARQAVRSTEVTKLDKIVGIDFSDKGECVVLVGGKTNGRALTVKVN